MKRYPKPWYYKPQNPGKYVGNVNQIVMRSSWEGDLALWCDMTPSCIQWGSEIAPIMYTKTLTETTHRYFPDFWIRCLDAQGKERYYIIEIKPHSQVKKPRKNAKQADKVLWLQNMDKWKAARAWCAANPPWEFKIMTEYELGRAQRPKKRKKRKWLNERDPNRVAEVLVGSSITSKGSQRTSGIIHSFPEKSRSLEACSFIVISPSTMLSCQSGTPSL